MIGLLILAPKSIGTGLIEAVTHILGGRPPCLETVAVNDEHRGPERIADDIKHHLTQFDRGDGVLILADIYGASHTNAACNLLKKGAVELVSGVNLPMLIRVLNHRNCKLGELTKKATSGGIDGIVCASNRLDSKGVDAA